MVENYNLNSHYSSNPKVQRKDGAVVSAPNSLPVKHVFQDKVANNRMRGINNDIYKGLKKEKNSEFKAFVSFIGLCVLSVLGYFGYKKFFK